MGTRRSCAEAVLALELACGSGHLLCPQLSYPTLKSDNLFEFGFAREAVSKLGCFPSKTLALLNFRIEPTC